VVVLWSVFDRETLTPKPALNCIYLRLRRCELLSELLWRQVVPVAETPKLQPDRLTVPVDTVFLVWLFALVYDHHGTTALFLQSTTDDSGCLQRIGFVLATVYNRAVSVTNDYEKS
jgi:hypothetical protein